MFLFLSDFLDCIDFIGAGTDRGAADYGIPAEIGGKIRILKAALLESAFFDPFFQISLDRLEGLILAADPIVAGLWTQDSPDCRIRGTEECHGRDTQHAGQMTDTRIISDVKPCT